MRIIMFEDFIFTFLHNFAYFNLSIQVSPKWFNFVKFCLNILILSNFAKISSK